MLTNKFKYYIIFLLKEKFILKRKKINNFNYFYI